jgi:hypothetical protein
MQKSHKITPLAFALSIIIGISIKPAQAANFTFSFDNTFGNVSGTLSGRIIGVDVDDPVADYVFIDSFPRGGSPYGTNLKILGDFEISSNAAEWPIISANNFLVGGSGKNKRIYESFFDARTGSLDADDIFCLSGAGRGCYIYTNYFTLDGGFTSMANLWGSAAVTFTLIPPEPIPFEFESTLGLLTLGGMFAGYAFARKRKIKNAPLD